LDDTIVAHRLAWGAMLVVQVRGAVGGEGAGTAPSSSPPAAASAGRAVIERLVQRPEYAGVRLIVAVSTDVPIEDDELLLWGIFTRFDCARDVIPARTESRGAWLTCHGPLGIDATWKTGYPDTVATPPEVIASVDAWWGQA
jgi:3-polyprenyl-4-hydroxybenzoate decarboxylase